MKSMTSLFPLALTVLLISVSCPLTAETVQKAVPDLPEAHAHPKGRTVLRVGPTWTPFCALSIDTTELPSLISALDSKDPAVRARASFYTGQVRYRKAIPKLLKLLNDYYPEVRSHAGIALASMGEREGIEECRTALAGGPDWIRYYAAFGLWCINSSRAREVLTSSKTGQSVFITKVIEEGMSPRATDLPSTVLTKPNHKPLSIDELWNRGLKDFVQEGDWWFHEGEYDQIIRCQEAALLLCPKDADLYATNAYLLWSLGRGDEADNTLKRGVGADPKSWETHYELGEHYMRTKRPALAEPELKIAVKLHGPLLAQHLYAHSLEKNGKIENALKEWDTIIKLNHADSVAIVNRDRVRKLIQPRK